MLTTLFAAWYRAPHFGIEPDIITIAKALGGGVPLAGVIGKQDIMDSPVPGGLGGTFGGSPIGCAAAHAVLDEIDQKSLCGRADNIGQAVVDRLTSLRANQTTLPIGKIRCLGAMAAFELVEDHGTNVPAPEKAALVAKRALESGLILLTCGIYGNTVRLLPPLTITDSVLD